MTKKIKTRNVKLIVVIEEIDLEMIVTIVIEIVTIVIEIVTIVIEIVIEIVTEVILNSILL